MKNNIKICIKINDDVIYQFSGKVNEQVMIHSANEIERILVANGANKEKIRNVYELFIETAQNILNYSSNSVYLKNNRKEVFCDFSLFYLTQDDTYILESCNLIEERQKEKIQKRVEVLKDLNEYDLRELIRKKSRSKEDHHERGAGLGYILMARKSSAPIETLFIPYEEGILQYKQRLSI